MDFALSEGQKGSIPCARVGFWPMFWPMFLSQLRAIARTMQLAFWPIPEREQTYTQVRLCRHLFPSGVQWSSAISARMSVIGLLQNVSNE
jgi:hypothetical protein